MNCLTETSWKELETVNERLSGGKQVEQKSNHLSKEFFNMVSSKEKLNLLEAVEAFANLQRQSPFTRNNAETFAEEGAKLVKKFTHNESLAKEAGTFIAGNKDISHKELGEKLLAYGVGMSEDHKNFREMISKGEKAKKVFRAMQPFMRDQKFDPLKIVEFRQVIEKITTGEKKIESASRFFNQDQKKAIEKSHKKGISL